MCFLAKRGGMLRSLTRWFHRVLKSLIRVTVAKLMIFFHLAYRFMEDIDKVYNIKYNGSPF